MKGLNCSTKGRTSFLLGLGISCLLLPALFFIVPLSPTSHANTVADAGTSILAQALETRDAQTPGDTTDSAKSLEQRTAEIEKMLQAIKIASQKSEERSYYNKMLGREMVTYVRVVVVILAIIAVVFPLTIWLMSRRRLLGLSGLSSEVAATLLMVEERQAKLANVLKEIQGEIDYLHTMSVPDLKNLIQQAESYLKQNEIDLEKTGSMRPSGQRKQ